MEPYYIVKRDTHNKYLGQPSNVYGEWVKTADEARHFASQKLATGWIVRNLGKLINTDYDHLCDSYYVVKMVPEIVTVPYKEVSL
jgi:hypothetical protein